MCVSIQAPSMDVKNMWVSEIRKVLTGQLEACRGIVQSYSIHTHTHTHIHTNPFSNSSLSSFPRSEPASPKDFREHLPRPHEVKPGAATFPLSSQYIRLIDSVNAPPFHWLRPKTWDLWWTPPQSGTCVKWPWGNPIRPAPKRASGRATPAPTWDRNEVRVHDLARGQALDLAEHGSQINQTCVCSLRDLKLVAS